jgi:aminoglycoside phosphotransferase (APT) family kinase protein
VVSRKKIKARLDGGTFRMSGEQDTFAGTMPVREGYGFDTVRLERWMAEHVESFSGPLTIEQFKGGQSNPTYKLLTPRCAYVMRRKPPGAILKGAHAVEREAKAIAALGQAGFPVAHMYGLCVDEEVIGTSFYVMEMVEGRIFWDGTFPGISPEGRPAYFDAMNATLARLHQIDYRSIGLAEYGKSGGYISRQIGLWTKQYLGDEDAGRDPNMDRLIEWLPAHIPAGNETTIVHGDFRCDNMIFHPKEPRVIAVLDWELSTLGDPLADFAYHAMMYRMPYNVLAGIAGVDVGLMNIPSESDYVKAYCQRTGRNGIANYAYYLAFNFFRLAAILHGIKGRVVRGTAVSAHASRRSESFPELAKLAWQQVR